MRPMFGRRCLLWVGSVWSLAFCVAAGEPEADRAVLERATAETEMLPWNLLAATKRGGGSLSELLETDRNLDVRLLESKNPRERGLAALALSFADDSGAIAKVAKLLDDDTPTVPRGLLLCTPLTAGEQYPVRQQTIKQLVADALSTRLGIADTESRLMVSAESFLAYWNSIKTPDLVASEWVFRFRKAVVRGEPTTALKMRVDKIEAPARGLIIASVHARLSVAGHAAYSDREVFEYLRKDLQTTGLRAFLEGKLRLPGMSLLSGPNAKDQAEVCKLILQGAPSLLDKPDAEWLLQMAAKEKLTAYCLMAAAKLNPQTSAATLEKALSVEPEQMLQTEMLLTLWEVRRDQALPVILTHFFKSAVPKYNTGGLQEDLVSRLAAKGAEGKPLLMAIMRDERFVGLTWTTTRAFARHAESILGEQCPEAQDYLKLQHPLGEYAYERETGKRTEYPAETRKIQDATATFQRYLQLRTRAS